MVVTLWLYGLELRLFTCSNVCMWDQYVCAWHLMIISNQGTEPKMTVDIGFLNLCTGVTTDDGISSWVTETEMTVHIGF